MPAYDVDLDKFADVDAQVVGISMDSPFSHIAWQKFEIGLLHFPLCSDFYPHGEVAGKYGVLRLSEPLPGISERAIFVVDKKGKIAYSKLYQLSQQPDNREALDALRKLV